MKILLAILAVVSAICAFFSIALSPAAFGSLVVGALLCAAGAAILDGQDDALVEARKQTKLLERMAGVYPPSSGSSSQVRTIKIPGL